MIRTTIVSLAAFVLLGAGTGCDITTCEEGAICHDDDDGDQNEESAREKCIGYCGRLSVCGGPQAEDFEHCVEACEVRFELLPEETAELIECAADSRCSDVIEGRCTGESPSGGSGTGGSPATAGQGNVAGSPATHAGSGGSGGSGQGGSPGTGGSSGSDGTCARAGSGNGAQAGDTSGSAGAAGDAPCSCPID